VLVALTWSSYSLVYACAARDGIIDDKQYVECRVLKFFPKKGLAEVSLRSSRINGDLDDDPVPSAGDIVQGFVQQTNKKGCFVRISRTTEGRATLKELCDGFLPNPEVSFPMGRLVVGMVKETRAATKKHSTGCVKLQVDLDMRESIVLGEEEKRLKFHDICVGDKFKGTVQRVETYGVFVKIENSNISGLVHMSECSDGFIKNLEALYIPGDLVKVLVLKKDDENEKLGFSMKASYFEDDKESDESSVDADIEMDDGDDSENDEQTGHMGELHDKRDSDTEELDSDDDNFATKLASKFIAHNSDTEESDVEKDKEANNVEDAGETSEDDDDDDENYSDDHGTDSNKEEDVETDLFDTNVGFDWGANGTGAAGGAENKNDDDNSTDDSDSESSYDDDEDGEGRPKSRKSKKRQAEKRRQEQETSRRESALADGTADDNPETALDFERLLAGEPNNSELWIRYMAFFLSLADVPAARAVADKALERIEFRRENEKLNVWTALFTLEHKYGSDATFQATIDRACQQNNPKQVYLRACEILEKGLQQSSYNPSDVVRADSLFAAMCKKHRSKKTVWLAHMQYLLRQSRHQEAHQLVKRAMSSLATYKHPDLMSRFAQMEFEHGSPERGRTLFDGLLLKFPKRLDLFFIYVDKECKYGKIEHARSMLEKKVNERRLSDRQMKSVFKKWYRIEEEHGTEETQELVKDSARAYVQQPRS
jgi:rRNA biogenesis protein RRP5